MTTIKLGMNSSILYRIFYYGLWYGVLFLAFIPSHFNSMFYVELPYREMFLPLLGWVSVLLYILTYKIICGQKTFKELFRKAFLLGIFFQFSCLLYDFNFHFSSDPRISRVYFFYFDLITIIFLVFQLLKGCSLFFKKDYFFIPILILSIHLVVLYFFIKPVLIGVVFLLFSLIAYLNQKRNINKGAYKIFNWIFSKDIHVIIIVFLVAFFMRELFSIQILHATQTDQTFITASDDGLTYDANSRVFMKSVISFLKDKSIFPPTFDVGYSIFLGIIYKIFGPNFYIVTFIQSILGALCAVLIFCTSRLIGFNRYIGMLAGILVGLNQPLIMYSVVLGTESIALFLMCLIVYIYLYHIYNLNQVFPILFLGILLGILFLVKSSTIWLCFFMFGSSLFIVPRKKIKKEILAFCFIFILINLMNLPLVFVNHYHIGKFHFPLSSGGHASAQILWESMSKYPYEMSPDNRRFMEIGINPFRSIRGSINVIVHHPIIFSKACLEVLPKRILNFFTWVHFGYVDTIKLLNPGKIKNNFGSTMEFYIWVVFFVGLIFLIKNWRNYYGLVMIFSVILYFLFVQGIIFNIQTVRYRLLITPLLVFVSAVGLYKTFDALWPVSEKK